MDYYEDEDMDNFAAVDNVDDESMMINDNDPQTEFFRHLESTPLRRVSSVGNLTSSIIDITGVSDSDNSEKVSPPPKKICSQISPDR